MGTDMSKCPNCKKDNAKPTKTWKYGPFDAQAFVCSNCGTEYRDYLKDSKLSFTLKRRREGQKGSVYVKA